MLCAKCCKEIKGKEKGYINKYEIWYIEEIEKKKEKFETALQDINEAYEEIIFMPIRDNEEAVIVKIEQLKKIEEILERSKNVKTRDKI